MLVRRRIVHRLAQTLRTLASQQPTESAESTQTAIDDTTTHIPAPEVHRPTVSPITKLGTEEWQPTEKAESEESTTDQPITSLGSQREEEKTEDKKEEILITWLGSSPRPAVDKEQPEKEGILKRTTTSLTRVEELPFELMPKFTYINKPQSPKEPLDVAEALQNVIEESPKDRDEPVRIAVSLHVDPRKSNQFVRGVTVLPHGTGKTIKIAVFADGVQAQQARDSQADIVGGAELIQKVIETEGKVLEDVNYCIATPSMMAEGMAKLGRIIGPRGLMPNPKLGTLTENVVEAMASLRKGRIEFRVDRQGNLNAVLGRVSFGTTKLAENATQLASDIFMARPEMFQKKPITKFIKKIVVSSPSGRGFPIMISELETSAQQTN